MYNSLLWKFHHNVICRMRRSRANTDKWKNYKYIDFKKGTVFAAEQPPSVRQTVRSMMSRSKNKSDARRTFMSLSDYFHQHSAASLGVRSPHYVILTSLVSIGRLLCPQKWEKRTARFPARSPIRSCYSNGRKAVVNQRSFSIWKITVIVSCVLFNVD